MLTIEPTGAVLGATIHGIDASQPIGERDFAHILLALGHHGVLRFPDQQLDMGDAAQRSRNASARSREPESAPDVAKDAMPMSARCRT